MDSTPDPFIDALDSLPPPPNTNGETLTLTLESSTTTAPKSDGDTTSTAANPPSPSLRRRRPPPKPPAPRSDGEAITSIHRLKPSPKPTADPTDPSLSTSKDQPVSDRVDSSSSISTLTSSSAAQDHEISSTSNTTPPRQPAPAPPPPPPPPPPPQSLLVSLAGLLIKAVFFQIKLLVKSFSFPLWLLYCSLLLAVDPVGTVRGWKDGVVGRISWTVDAFLGLFGPGKLVAGLAWGCLWCFYICFLLFGLLVTAFLAGGLVMGSLVEEPVKMTADLNFDYTKPSPDALVPLGGVGWGCSGEGGVGRRDGWRAVPPNHKLQLTVSLTLPESDYNRNLGVFQVRADFLSVNGKVTSTSRQPCMLRFKSTQIHFIESFLKSGTLLAGYSSESQIVKVKLTGFIEGTEPTECIRITLEQRAEYRPGAGIPEIYAASLKLESELPLIKRMIWNWRRTVFIWTSMGLFVWELFIVLLCCRPIIILRARPRGGPSRT